MERTTKAEVNQAFESLALALGKSTQPYDKVTRKAIAGAWYLDHNGVYGGYIVYEMDNERGGVSEPMNRRRMPSREFVQACRFAVDAIRLFKREHEL